MFGKLGYSGILPGCFSQILQFSLLFQTSIKPIVFFINFLQSKPQCKWHLCGIFDMFFSNFHIVIWRYTRKVINLFFLELKHRFLATEKWEWKSRYIGNENFLRGFSRRIQKNSIFISLLSVKFRIIWQMIDSRDNKIYYIFYLKVLRENFFHGKIVFGSESEENFKWILVKNRCNIDFQRRLKCLRKFFRVQSSQKSIPMTSLQLFRPFQ